MRLNILVLREIIYREQKRGSKHAYREYLDTR